MFAGASQPASAGSEPVYENPETQALVALVSDAATALKGKPEGWYHYEWPVPGGILPRWKS